MNAQRMAREPRELSADELVDEFKAVSQTFTGRATSLIPELQRRLSDETLREQLRPRAGELADYLHALAGALSSNLVIEQAEPLVQQALGMRTELYLMSTVPVEEERRLAEQGESMVGVGYVSRPGVPPIEQPAVRQYLSQNPLDLVDLTLPIDWLRHFTDEYRDTTTQLISDGYALELSRDFDGARERGAQAVDNIARMVREGSSGGSDMSTDRLLNEDPSSWTEGEREFVIDMLGKADWSAEEQARYLPEIVSLLRLINDGQFTEAFDRAAGDTTLGQALTTMLVETLEQRLSVHVPVGYLNIGVEGTVVNVRYSDDETFRMFLRGFLRGVLDQKYKPAVSIRETDGGSAIDVLMEPTDEFAFGGIGGGGGVGFETTAAHPMRTVSLELDAAYDPVADRPVFTGRLEFSDQSGEWTAPLDGVIYPSVYLEGGVDASGTTGHVAVGAMVEAGSSYFIFGDWSMFMLLSLDYIKRFGEPIVAPSENLELGFGGRVVYSDVVSLSGRYLLNPMNENMGFIGQAMVNVGAGVSLGFSGGFREVDINIFRSSQAIIAPELSFNIGWNIDDFIKYLRE
ncbi:MAG: hypothetical protein PHQ80_01185 [Candidatus ainarchaeum sp.]|nr:hypothetical protein [Candidatus ainarchaeum sp.]MDD5095954.1 hypothetical protein [Candidatus ainarchaeum sp.]